MILDSNILIGYLRGEGDIVAALQAWRASGLVLCISVVSSIEVLSLGSLTAADVSATENFLADFLAISIDAEIVRTAGALRRAYHLTVPDAVIVATAIVRHMPLATRDRKMRSVSGVELAEI